MILMALEKRELLRERFFLFFKLCNGLLSSKRAERCVVHSQMHLHRTRHTLRRVRQQSHFSLVLISMWLLKLLHEMFLFLFSFLICGRTNTWHGFKMFCVPVVGIEIGSSDRSRPVMYKNLDELQFLCWSNYAGYFLPFWCWKHGCTGGLIFTDFYMTYYIVFSELNSFPSASSAFYYCHATVIISVLVLNCVLFSVFFSFQVLEMAKTNLLTSTENSCIFLLRSVKHDSTTPDSHALATLFHLLS